MMIFPLRGGNIDVHYECIRALNGIGHSLLKELLVYHQDNPLQ